MDGKLVHELTLLPVHMCFARHTRERGRQRERERDGEGDRERAINQFHFWGSGVTNLLDTT
jgi:hypothetical protein